MSKNLLLFGIFLCCFFIAPAQYMWQINKDSVITWYYQDGDEFNDTKLDMDKWDNGFPWGRTVMSQDLYFTSGEDLEESNGTLKFALNKRDYKVKLTRWDVDSAYLKKSKIVLDNDTFPFKYTAGLIWSKQKYKYGYFEMRFKCPKNGKGMWPAFWMFGGNKNDEIDFFEIKCEKNNYVHVDVHCPDGCRNYIEGPGFHKAWGGWIKTKDYFDNGYNTIAGEWQNGYVKWYLNGKGIAYFKGSFETAMSVIANMSVAKDGGPFDPGPDESTVYPGIMDVDYIRIWTKDNQLQKRVPVTFEEKPSAKSASSELKGNKSSMKKKKRLLYGKKTKYKNEGVFVSLLRNTKTSYLLTMQGNETTPVSIEIKDTTGKIIFSESKYTEEFLQINMADLAAGNYTFVVKYNDKIIQQEINYK
ncbi:MAG: family 16 glycosylhydrolase [Bacteroidota bacterium]|nr:family 16 glycosylhydrolase [Bacteroidota bacterium]